MKRLAIIIISAGIALIAVSAFQFFMRPGAGDVAPPFVLQSVSGTRVSSDEFSGRPMLVHFWATWCGYCRDEFPSLVRLAGEQSKDGLAVIAVSEDDIEDKAEVEKFLGAGPHPFPVLLDHDGLVADAYGSYGMPETVAVGRDGRIVRRFEGMVDWNSKEAREFTDSLLK